MSAPSVPAANQIVIHVSDDVAKARRHRRRHRHWGSAIVAISFPFLTVLMVGGAYYFVLENERTLKPSNNQSEVRNVERASAVASRSAPNSRKSNSLSPAIEPPTQPRSEPVVLLAAGATSPFSETRDTGGQPTRDPATRTAARGRDAAATSPPQAGNVPAESAFQPRNFQPDIGRHGSQVEDFSHWTSYDARWHTGLYESTRSPREHNSIDRVVFEDLRKHGLEPAKLCSDETFLRRVYIDVLGTLPTADQAREFVNDHSTGKRNHLIEQVLQQPEFADYWAMKWSDILRVKAEFPINLWPQAAQAYHHWIRSAIANNMPYDQFARELLTASGSNFRVPQVNFYRALQSHEPKAIAQVVALTFMGERTEAWPTERTDGMCQFFSRVGYKPTGEWKEEIVFFDRRRDGKVTNETVRAVYPGSAPVEILSDQDPRRVFADWLTDDRNPWFARVLANRVWCWLVGRGIVSPVDDIRIDNRASNPKLLDQLASELIASDYDVKQLIRVILQSSTYQQSCIPHSQHADAAKHFAFYQPRRLDAEVLIDAICQITGTTETYMSIIPEPFTFLPETQRAIALPDGSITSSFLQTFGRPSRDTGLDSERDNRLTAGQALHLLNSNHIRDKIRRGEGIQDLLRRSKGRFETVDLLYLSILSRRPTEGELTIGGPLCESNNGAQDLAWALINSDEFLFRH